MPTTSRLSSVTLTLPGGVRSAEAFDRKAGKWVDLKVADRRVSFPVEEAAVELVRFTR